MTVLNARLNETSDKSYNDKDSKDLILNAKNKKQKKKQFMEKSFFEQ